MPEPFLTPEEQRKREFLRLAFAEWLRQRAGQVVGGIGTAANIATNIFPPTSLLRREVEAAPEVVRGLTEFPRAALREPETYSVPQPIRDAFAFLPENLRQRITAPSPEPTTLGGEVGRFVGRMAAGLAPGITSPALGRVPEGHWNPDGSWTQKTPEEIMVEQAGEMTFMAPMAGAVRAGGAPLRTLAEAGAYKAGGAVKAGAPRVAAGARELATEQAGFAKIPGKARTPKQTMELVDIQRRVFGGEQVSDKEFAKLQAWQAEQRAIEAQRAAVLPKAEGLPGQAPLAEVAPRPAAPAIKEDIFVTGARAKTEAEMPEMMARVRQAAQPKKLPIRPVAKDAWKLTLDQYITKYGRKGQDPGIQRAFFGQNHKLHIEQALREGKPVPAEVLADYPELAARVHPAPAAPAVEILPGHYTETKKLLEDLTTDTLTRQSLLKTIGDTRLNQIIEETRNKLALLESRRIPVAPAGTLPEQVAAYKAVKPTPVRQRLPEQQAFFAASEARDNAARELVAARKSGNQATIDTAFAKFLQAEEALTRAGTVYGEASVARFAPRPIVPAEAVRPTPMHPTLGRPLTAEEIALRKRLQGAKARAEAQGIQVEPSAPPPRRRMTAAQRAEVAALERELGFARPTEAVPAPPPAGEGVAPPSPRAGAPQAAEVPPATRKPLYAMTPEEAQAFQAGGARAPAREAPPPPPPPPTAEAAMPTEFPSGRKPGGIGRQIPWTPEDDYQKVVDAVTPKKPTFQERVSQLKVDLSRKYYTDWYPLRQLSRDTGVPADKLIQVVPGSTAAGEDIVRTMVDPIWQPLGKDVPYLEQYMVLMRNQDLLARSPSAQLPGAVGGWSGTIRALNTLERKVGTERFARIKATAEQLWRADDEAVLKPLLGEGLLDLEGYTATKANNPHYIPWNRADFETDLMRGFTRPSASVSSTGLKKLELAGSERALDNPLVRFRAKPIIAQQIIARNRAARGIVEALQAQERATGERLVTFIEPKAELSMIERVTLDEVPRALKGEHSAIVDTISYFEKGKKVMVEVPALYASIAKGMEWEANNLLTSILSKLSAPLRLGAVTYNPAFLPVNLLRDAYTAFFRERLIPFSPEYFRGWNAVIRKTALYSEAARSGGLMSGIVDTMRDTRAMSRVRQMGAITVQNPKDALLLVPRLIAKANLTAEQATRVAVFGKLRAQGIDALEAAIRMRDATVDFSKMGSHMRVINQIVPFSNAAVQGTANVLRTIKAHPKWATAMLGLFSVPTVLSRVNNMRFETSKLIPHYEYTNYWVIQVGEGEKADKTKFPIYIKVPKGQIGSMLTFGQEALFNLAQEEGDKSAAELVLESAFGAAQTTSPIDPSVVAFSPPILKTGAGLATGVNAWTGIPIVPGREENLPPEQQFGEETSAASVALGKASGVSPRMIDFAVKDYTAGTGQGIMWLLDAGLKAIGYNPEPFGGAVAEERTGVEAASRIPVISRFLGTRGTQLERQGWEEFDKVTIETNRAFNQLPRMNSLGIRLGSVGDSIDLVPGVKGGSVDLTPAQRADYQRIMGEVVTAGIVAYLPQVSPTLPLETQKEKIQKRIGKLKDQAKAQFLAMYRVELKGQQKGQVAPPPTPAQPQGSGEFWDFLKRETTIPQQGTPAYEQFKARYPAPTPVGAGR